MDYEQAAELIKSVEAEDPATRSVVVSLADSEDKVEIREYSEKDVRELVGFVEKVSGSQTAGTAQAPSAQVEAAQQNPDIHDNIDAAGVKKKTIIDKAFDDAGRELEKAVAGVENKVDGAREKSQGQQLVLVNLSLNDQINELEKISFGLDGNVFTPEQRRILIMEVNGLLKKKEKPAGDFQKDLAVLRDKRLKEVSYKLGIK